MTLLKGMMAFPLSPVDEHGNILEYTLASHLNRIVRAGAQSVCIMGSTGAFAYLSMDQRRRALDLTIGMVGDRIPVLVNVSALDTVSAVALARHATGRGAKGLLLAPMSYTPLTEEEVFGYYSTVAQTTDVPVCIYNNPSTTRFSFSFKLIAELAEIPNVSGIKMPLPPGEDFGGELERLRSTTPSGFTVGYSGDWAVADALLAGADTWYSVVAGLLPVHALALFQASRTGDRAAVRRLDEAFQPLWELFRRFGSLRVMYAMSGLLGLGDLALPRPLLPLPAEAYPRLVTALDGLLSSD